MSGERTVRQLLVGLPMLAPPLPRFDPEQAPKAPFPLFLDWLAAAVEAGVREPHAMVLATAEPDGGPDARVVALRDADEDGWTFAAQRHSPKHRQLQRPGRAALLFHWREQGRQIRVRGVARHADAERSVADFLARPPVSRAAGLVGRQSEPLADPAELDAAFAAALARAEADPQLVDPAHVLVTVVPDSVEFWQGDPGRAHVRLRYARGGPQGRWRRERLWP
ncbi:pyridoxine/pyridoxamine 5'-phosphate oxidase [Streptacidiphilus monticola]|uniref:Pyridoxal 5'-phosphate synthase n=1 Tax=Streptacidiphilus monticola TaxID=2161674 RepID=A0ABW1G999_9ACTN